MLAVMTYNIEIFFCTLAGIIIGYAIFLRKKSGSDTTLCCQEPDTAPTTAPASGLAPTIAPGNVRSTFAIRGMTCNACVRTIYNHLQSLSGVAGQDVSLANERAIVEHDGTISAQQIAGEIDDIGFDATITVSGQV